MFDFFQAVRLLESFIAGKSQESGGQIHFRPHNGLAFPATDVKSIELLDGDPMRARLTATFLGLYGVDSPLPVYFYDSIAVDSEEAKPMRDFLDIFNNRLYQLFYQSWKKYRLAVQYGSRSSRDVLMVRALSLAGLGTKGAVDDSVLPSMRLASFAGALSARVRNADGLRNLIAEFLGGVEVGVLENIPRWVMIHRRARVGGKGTVKAVLGSTACIGEQVHDVSGKFRVILGPLTLVQYLALLPGGLSAKLVLFLIRMYVRDYLAYDVELNLMTREIPVNRLGDGTSRLGLTTWLGRPGTPTTSRIVSYN